ncbi:hypothetical protein O3M35_000025 [Rhynocoris fuscipes]|uniref:Uncharacterized protein n=1 Tax=Rhynocoris fuscipes TaxID=488301 RepID=A0AAW1DL80_9HEMI
MATDILHTKLDSLHIVGEDRIKKARERDEDIAILSTFLPASFASKLPSKPFICALGKQCMLGDSKLATPGILVFILFYLFIYFVNSFKENQHLRLSSP